MSKLWKNGEEVLDSKKLVNEVCADGDVLEVELLKKIVTDDINAPVMSDWIENAFSAGPSSQRRYGVNIIGIINNPHPGAGGGRVDSSWKTKDLKGITNIRTQ